MSSASPRSATKAVIPVAGMGTRFLPATKAVPKELLPVVDRPALEYIVEEAARAGLPEVLMVTGRNKGAIEDFFDRTPELEAALEKKGDAARLAAVARVHRASRRCTSSARARPGASGTRCCRPPRSSATSRSRCCSATT